MSQKKGHIMFLAALGGIALTLFGFSTTQVLDSTNSFALLARDQLVLGQDVTVSSGDVGVSGRKGTLTTGQENTLSSNLFAQRVVLGPRTTVNGNATFENLTKTKEATILGDELKTFKSSFVDFPAVFDFQTGTEQFRTKKGETATLSPGNFKSITTSPNTTLTLEPGTYNTETLTLGNGTTIHFLGTTTINIKGNTTIGNSVVFSQPNTPAIDDIVVNSAGKQLSIGTNAVTHGIITAPEATVTIGQQTLHRGQIVGKHIVVGKGAMFSREESFEKESDPTIVVEDENGVQFIGNELVVLFEDTTTFADVQIIADLVAGIITGFVPEPFLVKIEVHTTTAAELNDAVNMIKNSGNLRIIEVIPNIIGN